MRLGKAWVMVSVFFMVAGESRGGSTGKSTLWQGVYYRDYRWELVDANTVRLVGTTPAGPENSVLIPWNSAPSDARWALEATRGQAIRKETEAQSDVGQTGKRGKAKRKGGGSRPSGVDDEGVYRESATVPRPSSSAPYLLMKLAGPPQAVTATAEFVEFAMDSRSKTMRQTRCCPRVTLSGFGAAHDALAVVVSYDIKENDAIWTGSNVRQTGPVAAGSRVIVDFEGFTDKVGTSSTTKFLGQVGDYFWYQKTPTVKYFQSYLKAMRVQVMDATGGVLYSGEWRSPSQ